MSTNKFVSGADYPGFGIKKGDCLDVDPLKGKLNIDPEEIYLISVSGVLSLCKMRREDDCFVFIDDDGAYEIFPIESLAHLTIFGAVTSISHVAVVKDNVVSLAAERRRRRNRACP